MLWKFVGISIERGENENMEIFKWSRTGGYECSSKGDRRFSAFYAKLADGRTIEQHYQCDVKGYDVGGTNWKLGKGKPPLKEMTQDVLWEKYLSLWREWMEMNIPLMRELYLKAKENDYILSDRFAKTPINQAHALSVILNVLCSK